MRYIALIVAAVLIGVMAYLPMNERKHDREPQKLAIPFELLELEGVVNSAITAVKNTVHAVRASHELWKGAVATVFWVGEGETSDNDYISNTASAWDEEWQEHYGGVDAPESRCGFRSCAFQPKENPFYIALPYDDIEDGVRKKNTSYIPWDNPTSTKSVLKNRWIAVKESGTTCYGQWEDVGPFETDDAEYVFGAAEKPKNMFGEKAGIDLSPALRDCLNLGDVADVEWRFVEEHEVPIGPWKEIVTRRI